jgi:hypothetical protein|nr:MAG TPA: hypothetical protein [Caudoviricetes sp.]
MIPTTLFECFQYADYDMMIFGYLRKYIRDVAVEKFGIGGICNCYKSKDLRLAISSYFFDDNGTADIDTSTVEAIIQKRYNFFMRKTTTEERIARMKSHQKMIDFLMQYYTEEVDKVGDELKRDILKTYGRLRLQCTINNILEQSVKKTGYVIDPDLIDTTKMYIIETTNATFDDMIIQFKDILIRVLIDMDNWLKCIIKTDDVTVFYKRILCICIDPNALLTDNVIKSSSLALMLQSIRLYSNPLKKDFIFNGIMLRPNVIFAYGNNKRDLLVYDTTNERYALIREGDMDVDVYMIQLIYMQNKDRVKYIDYFEVTLDDSSNSGKRCRTQCKPLLSEYTGSGPIELVAQSNYYNMDDPNKILRITEIDLT